jgi:hypothetical protein
MSIWWSVLEVLVNGISKLTMSWAKLLLGKGSLTILYFWGESTIFSFKSCWFYWNLNSGDCWNFFTLEKEEGTLFNDELEFDLYKFIDNLFALWSIVQDYFPVEFCFFSNFYYGVWSPLFDISLIFLFEPF